MDIVEYGLKKPVTVAVAVILVVTFGLIGLSKLPIQLTPDVETPRITVKTVWNGATPFEIEKEIIMALTEREIPIAVLATKCDKLSKNALSKNIANYKEEMYKNWEVLPQNSQYLYHHYDGEWYMDYY